MVTNFMVMELVSFLVRLAGDHHKLIEKFSVLILYGFHD